MANYLRKDSYYNQAKESGFRSRAYFKLQDIQQKHSIIKPGDKVIDMGAWPGGWVQCARKIVGKRGLVTAIDLQALDPFEEDNIHIVEGDLRDEDVMQSAKQIAGGRYDVAISDMSPKLTGIKDADRWACVGLLELAMYCSDFLLKPGGHFVAKAFKSNESEEFVRSIRNRFDKVTRREVKSTRKTSTEFYIVGCGFKVDIDSL